MRKICVVTGSRAEYGILRSLMAAIKNDPDLTDVKTLYIDDICVDSACRGQGVGRALYERCVAYARENGFYNLTLNVWTCNPGALRFYEAMGLAPQKIGMELVLENGEQAL